MTSVLNLKLKGLRKPLFSLKSAMQHINVEFVLAGPLLTRNQNYGKLSQELISSTHSVTLTKNLDGTFRGILQLANNHNFLVAYKLKSTDPDLFLISPSMYGLLGKKSNKPTEITISTNPKVQHGFGDVRRNLFLIITIPVNFNDEHYVIPEYFEWDSNFQNEIQMDLKDFWKNELEKKRNLICGLNVVRLKGKYKEVSRFDQIADELSKSVWVRTTVFLRKYFNLGILDDPDLNDLFTRIEQLREVDDFHDLLISSWLHFSFKSDKMKAFIARKFVTVNKKKLIDALVAAKKFGKQFFITMLGMVSVFLTSKFFGGSSISIRLDKFWRIF